MPWPWAGVLAQGLALVGQIKSINYSGAYDKGGYIPSGAVGLVGEIGPELIKGPATVTGRKDTAEMLRQNSITVNLSVLESTYGLKRVGY